MFDKIKFAQILKNITETYESQREFSKKSAINRTYLSQYMNMKLDNPPTPKILKRIADSSKGITSYDELMTMCGYFEQNNVNDLIQQLKLLNLDKAELEKAITAFVENYMIISDNPTVDIYNMEDSIIYYAYEIIIKYYFKLINKELTIQTDNTNVLIDKQDFFEKAEGNAWIKMKAILESIDEDKIVSDLTAEERAESFLHILNNKKTFNIPIVGKIAAGQPILAEEYIEGYIPVDPNIYGMETPDDYFYLLVSGQSMNLKVKNGDYALIRKQDYAENGDIVVAIVNGDDEATLKKYKKLNEQFVLLEPMSSDPTIEAITIDLKSTNFKIIGKAIGYFGKI